MVRAIHLLTFDTTSFELFTGWGWLICKIPIFAGKTMIYPFLFLDFIYLCVHAKLLQSCPILCHPIDCSPPGSSVCGILQARTLEWVAILFSRGSSPRDWTRVSWLQADSLLLRHGGSPVWYAIYSTDLYSFQKQSVEKLCNQLYWTLEASSMGKPLLISDCFLHIRPWRVQMKSVQGYQ